MLRECTHAAHLHPSWGNNLAHQTRPTDARARSLLVCIPWQPFIKQGEGVDLDVLTTWENPDANIEDVKYTYVKHKLQFKITV